MVSERLFGIGGVRQLQRVGDVLFPDVKPRSALPVKAVKKSGENKKQHEMDSFLLFVIKKCVHYVSVYKINL